MQQSKGITQIQVSEPGTIPAQIYAQARLKLQQADTYKGGSPVTTLVKGVRTINPQCMHQLQIQCQLLQRKEKFQ